MNRIVRYHESARYWARNTGGSQSNYIQPPTNQPPTNQTPTNQTDSDTEALTELTDLKLILSEIIQADDLSGQTDTCITSMPELEASTRLCLSLEELDKTRQERVARVRKPRVPKIVIDDLTGEATQSHKPDPNAPLREGGVAGYPKEKKPSKRGISARIATYPTTIKLC